MSKYTWKIKGLNFNNDIGHLARWKAEWKKSNRDHFKGTEKNMV